MRVLLTMLRFDLNVQFLSYHLQACGFRVTVTFLPMSVDAARNVAAEFVTLQAAPTGGQCCCFW